MHADAPPRAWRLGGTARDDVDDAEERVRAVHRRHRAADQLDARDLVDRHQALEAKPGERAPRLVYARAVDQDENAGVEVTGDRKAADADRVREPSVDEIRPGD